MIVHTEGATVVATRPAQESGNTAKGAALAILFNKQIASQARDMARTLKSLCDLDYDGRKAFRAELSKRRSEARALVKASDNDPIVRRAMASATVRISEAMTFSRAADAGYVPSDEISYHDTVAEARVFLEACAKGGEEAPEGAQATEGTSGAKRGRKALTNVQKAINFLEKLELSPEELAALVEALQNIQVQHAEAQ